MDIITYGTKPASYLSVRAMHHFAKDEVETFHWVPKSDADLICGGSTKEEVVGIIFI